jgi:dienelactone hydrolase
MMIVLFHSALGLRAVERDIAATLRDDGHDVVVPDLYGGRTADTLEHGLALGLPRLHPERFQLSCSASPTMMPSGPRMKQSR